MIPSPPSPKPAFKAVRGLMRRRGDAGSIPYARAQILTQGKSHFTLSVVTHRVEIESGFISPDNFDESMGARDLENAASM